MYSDVWTTTLVNSWLCAMSYLNIDLGEFFDICTVMFDDDLGELAVQCTVIFGPHTW
jgi:hypothetical protein